MPTDEIEYLKKEEARRDLGNALAVYAKAVTEYGGDVSLMADEIQTECVEAGIMVEVFES